MPIVLATGYSAIPTGTASELERLAKPFTQHDLAQAVASAATRPLEKARVLPFRRG
jgi:hypothetical protein